ncbi:undecaprenyl-diphosphate phosphatase [Azospirillum halopraeferens]|uniref:undecaprenyl-diphosphate phosphatase n=1 Tax=Azospirillum halopraeferens TaxID=34010 RepID=UPI00041CC5C4|nr:undecaprenyl-diphosphate phosphatase [Azospirillum halopraeferens]
MAEQLLQAALLGIVEGLTEFIPVSSTGHLILVIEILGFAGPPGRVFEVAIQLGAILAVCLIYFGRLWRVTMGLGGGDPRAWRFVLAILLGFLPAAVLGVLLHGFIKAVLFHPTVVCVALILGGIAILVIERFLSHPRYHEIERFPASLALKIGLFQSIAMIPGVSRSGATILGALLMGVDRRTAAEFSFFLAIPTMLGATVLDLYKNWEHLNTDDALLIGVGFVTAFLAAAVVVRTLVDFVGRYGFAPFGWYRIALGSLMLAFLYL